MFSGGYRWVFSYVLPPLIGAGIGYLTNAVAIRMLFRPFAEKRILGIKIPFTPGIIPKYRYQLAENIGEMVAKELLSHQMLEEHFLSEGFRQQVLPRVEELIIRWENKKAGDLITLFNNLRRQNRDFAESRCLKTIKKAVLQGDIGNLKIHELLYTGTETASANIFRNIYPVLLDSVMQTLKTPEIRKTLEEKGRTFLEEVQEKLNFFQKFMINAGRYDKTLKSRMPEIVDDLLDKLRIFAADPETVEYLTQSVQAGIGSYGQLTLRDFIENTGILDSAAARKEPLLRILFFFRRSTVKEVLGLNEKNRQHLINLLMGLGIEQIVVNLDSILRVLDIRGLVVNRINKLNIEDVERILLIIIEKHLTWINIFGAFLGALIGGVQIFIRVFTV